MIRLLQISVHFEYGDAIEILLDRHGVLDFVRYPVVQGKDRDGKHYGTRFIRAA
jgi:hypothetical protein